LCTRTNDHTPEIFVKYVPKKDFFVYSYIEREVWISALGLVLLEPLSKLSLCGKKSKKGNFMTKSFFASLSKYMGALVLLMATSTAQAKTIKVTCDADPTCPGGTTLRQAVAKANNGDTIVFSSRVTSIMLNVGSIIIGTSITINGGSNVTIDGNHHSSIFVVEPSNVTLTGLTLQNGFDINGGAISSFGATLTVKECVFANNTAHASGGAIFNQGTLNISDSTFSGNTAIQNNGGAILSGGTMAVADSSFVNNSALSDGGAIFIGDSTAMITSSIFTGNTSIAASGGALFINSAGTLTVNASTLSDNVASSVGGAISNSGTLTVADSTLTDNVATTCCAIFNSPGSTFQNQNNSISGACTGPNVCGP
jgi:predicted outer membrane repeat protein